MSKVAITGNASGTGVFTVASPNSNTDRVLTLPDETGTVLTGVSSLVAGNLTGSVPTSAMPAGSVIQVVQAFKTDTAVHASSSYTDISGLVVTITPSSATNKILVMFNVQATCNTNTVQLRITRNGTEVGIADAASSRVRTTVGAYWPTTDANHQSFPFSACFLDSPSTISELTYKIQVKSQDGVNVFINRSANDADNSDWGMRSTSNITLMEIAG